MSKPKLTDAVRDEILAKWMDKEFTYLNFTHITEKFKSRNSSVTSVLKSMFDKGLLSIVGEISQNKGGATTKIYAVIPRANIASVTVGRNSKEYAVEKEKQARYMSQCADRLDMALNRMVERR